MDFGSVNFSLLDADLIGKDVNKLVKKFETFLDAFESYGQNSVTINWMIPVDVESARFLDEYTNSLPWLIDPPTLEVIEALTAAAHKRDFKVIWKPQFLTNEPDGGNVNHYFAGPDFDAVTFLQEVTKFWQDWAPIAEKNKVEMLILGSENDDYAVGQYEAAWRQIIANVRSVYTGDVTYDSFGDVGVPGSDPGGVAADDIKFWDALDYISISMYVPLNSGGPKTLENAISELYTNTLGGWLKPPVNVPAVFADLATRYGKDIFFAEAGTSSGVGVLEHPPLAPSVADTFEQSILYATLLQEFSKFSWFKGFNWWSNYSDVTPIPRSENWREWADNWGWDFGFLEKPSGDLVRGYWLFGNNGAPIEGELMLGSRSAETFTGSDLSDLIVAADGADVLRGGSGNDRLFGGDGHDRIFGDDGDDIIFGGSSFHDERDVINGGNGDDIISGGAGNDKLRGGAGSDIFVFFKGDGKDKTFNFELGIDKIAIENGAKSFNDLHFEKRGKNVIVEFSDVQIVLVGEELKQIADPDNFLFDIVA